MPKIISAAAKSIQPITGNCGAFLLLSIRLYLLPVFELSTTDHGYAAGAAQCTMKTAEVSVRATSTYL
ncbi:hypothetical protein BAE46_13335 [Glaciecola punicea]|nr:hypothetical protein BAE46_13335 [Glaciecola punicea]